jgi:hypothetical protein
MIIDCHGHYTTAPKELEEYRKRQIASLKDATQVAAKGPLKISDDQIRESLENAQLRIQRSAAPISRSSRRGRAGWGTTSATPPPASTGRKPATS